ncbi:LysM peptidoglycan-binding domain-containing protein [Photobacterium lipolyticum]|uniref:Peptigoglycan-binding protein LysM n=1 Tax=Photobacterium lipolyticum TaxID=266810 RepID=A0A2T3MSZ7_9GAMM|nr:LysM peptidoglycan-binding domain-containing protein [Photobacterium lipolyticum]PSW01432.1 peptigoglycan-binding protein LysM [Photobacterium lipolyticum]
MRVCVLLLILISSFSVCWAHAVLPSVKKNILEVYTVKKGDTLWDISAYFLENPWLWPQLWQANGYIKNPHLIYPGDQLHLVWVNDRPQLQFKKNVVLSPQIRVKHSAITTLQETLIFPYLAENKLITEQSLAQLPRVLGASEQRGYMSRGDKIWVDSELLLGTEWWVYRVAAEFVRKDKPDGKVISLKEVARLRTSEIQENMSLMTVESCRQEISQNDILLPAPITVSDVDMHFSPSKPPVDTQASVLGHLEGHRYIATSQVVVLDRGHLDNLAAGNVLQLFKPGAKVTGNKGDYAYKNEHGWLSEKQQLSRSLVGEVMIIRPYEYFSLAVVTRSLEPFRAGTLALPPRLTDR